MLQLPLSKLHNSGHSQLMGNFRLVHLHSHFIHILPAGSIPTSQLLQADSILPAGTLSLPAHASEHGNVIRLVSVYMSSKKIVIERTRDLIYLKFVETDFSPKIISPSAGELRWLSVALAILQFLPCWWTLYQIVLIICHFATPTTSLRINTSLVVSSGQTLYRAAPLETKF